MSGANQAKAYQVRVKGRVQRVGFRRHVVDLAQEMGLDGYVENLPDGAVRILVQGEESLLSRFTEMIKEAPPPASVREVELQEVALNPEIKGFRIVYGELGDELQEGFGGMQTIFMEYWREFRDYRNEFRGFVGEFRDYRDEFRKEFRDYRDEFRGFVGEFRDYRDEFRDFAHRTDENFKLILEKYGEISSKLTVILEILIKEIGETRRMLNETMKTLKEVVEILRVDKTITIK